MASQTVLRKFNPNHDKRGRFARKPEATVSSVQTNHPSLDGALSWIDVKPKSSFKDEPLDPQAEGHVRDALSGLGQVVNLDRVTEMIRGDDRKIGLNITHLPKGTGGQFIISDIMNEPMGLEINGRQDMSRAERINAVVHELGHYLDFLMGRRGFESRMMGGVLKDTMKAIEDSPSVKRYFAAYEKVAKRFGHYKLNEKERPPTLGITKFNSDEPLAVYSYDQPGWIEQRSGLDDFFKYTTSREELFARAFAQWYLEKALPSDKEAWSALLRTNGKRTGRIIVDGELFDQLPQWPRDEFRPIFDAIDKALEFKGLLR